MSESRRSAIKKGLGAAAAIAAAPAIGAAQALTHTGLPALPADSSVPRDFAPSPTRALYRQSVARWCFGNVPLPELCAQAQRIGLHGIDLLSENEWDIPKQHGLVCTVANGPGQIADGWNRPDLHDRLVAESERLLPLVARAGIAQMIVFSGNRRGMSDAEGIANCVTGLARIIPLAERLGVTLVMEMLNSKVDHRDYHADRTEWAVQVARGLGSDRFKLLYDIYHMQIMEGDVVRTIERYAPFIGHYHTAGNPGRHELDETQELYYPRIAKAIAETGFTGFVAHEFMPTTDPFGKLAAAQRIFANV